MVEVVIFPGVVRVAVIVEVPSETTFRVFGFVIVATVVVPLVYEKVPLTAEIGGINVIVLLLFRGKVTTKGPRTGK